MADSHLTANLARYPEAIRSWAAIGNPNDPIALFTGPIDFTQGGNTFRAEGRVFLRWPPFPQVRFAVPELPSGVHPELKELSFRLDDGTTVSSGHVTNMTSSMSAEGPQADSLSGAVADRVTWPHDAPVHHAVFLLPNFESLIGEAVCYASGRSVRRSRLSLRSGGWLVTLDATENQKATREALGGSSGFGITHVGRLEKEDGKSFTAADATPILDALASYLSFAAGRWTGPCLPTGFDANGKQAWQVWDFARTAPFQRRSTWLDRNHSEQFEAPFPGFMGLWFDKDWGEVIRVAIHWYVEANAQAGSIEGSIVLTQTAFELLSSVVLVENHGWLSADGYEKLTAADRIRLLFLWAGIPTAVPTELVNLTQQAKADNWPDTATAMTRIRNMITHPTKKNRGKFDKQSCGARFDAWTLGLWNLELCLLRLFKHQGTYGNRVKRRWVGDVEAVPWVPQPET